MIFPHAETFSTKERWVREIASEIGLPLGSSGRINLPRHPSQLYEAFFEGLFLWVILWFIVRKRKKFEGQMIGSYLLGYGLVRFFIEYFREPDPGGFPIALAPDKAYPQALFLFPLNFSTGNIRLLHGFCSRDHRSRSARAGAGQERTGRSGGKKLSPEA
jgi:phosphatidylglycerol:prolipoprotein diacylglycerol transferase